jgi:hypothetical protein
MNDWPVTPIVTGRKNWEGYVPTLGTVTASTESLLFAATSHLSRLSRKTNQAFT